MTGVPEAAAYPASAALLERFRRKIALNAAGWLEFARTHRDDARALDQELANLWKAAQQALDEPEAWEHGLALVEESWRHIELRGYWQMWQELLQEALSVSQKAGLRRREAQLLDQLGELARILGDYRAAMARFDAALAIFRALDDEAGFGRVQMHASQIHLAQGDLAAGERCCQQAVAIFSSLDSQNDLAIAHNNWGIILFQQGAPEAALSHFQTAAAGFADANNRRGLAKATANQGDVHRQAERWPEADSCYRQAIALDLATGHEVHANIVRMNLGIACFLQGRIGEALALHQEVEPQFRRMGDRPQLARVNNNMGIFLACLGRFGESKAAFDSAVRLHLEMNDRLLATDTLTNCAEHLLDQGRVDDAAGYLQRGRELLDTLPSPPDYLLRDWDRQWQRLAAMESPHPTERPAG